MVTNPLLVFRCGAGPKYCENKCTPQFSIGSCSGKDNSKTRSHVYDWWELYGPGGSRHGRIQPPADFPKPLRVSEARDEDENPEPLSKSSADDDVSLLLFRQIKLEPNAMLPLDAVCNATASKPSGGCQSSCCLDGRCTYCDKCAPKANVSSAGCKWCMKLKKPVSPEGCLFRGDVCTLPKGMAAVNPLSGCKTGCCKNGKCTWCEDCYLGCKCRDLGQPLNPDGRCVTRTRTTSRTKTKTRTTTTVKGSGPGRGLRFESCVGAGMVALTFDDGPYGHTEELLNKLKRRGIKATFFVNGQNQWNIYDRANLIRRMRDEGHCIASHGWRHDNELALGFDGTLQNLRQISDAIESIVGLRPKLHRPPFGDYDQETQRAAALVGQDIIIWNVDTKV